MILMQYIFDMLEHIDAIDTMYMCHDPYFKAKNKNRKNN